MRTSTASEPFFNEPDSDYFSSGAWGSTEARTILLSKRLAADRRCGLVKKKESKAFDMGHAWDDLLSTRKSFADLFAVKPADYDGRTKEGKAIIDEAGRTGKRILSFDDASSLRLMLERMPSQIRSFVDKMPSQQITRVPMMGWHMQSKADLVSVEHQLIIDIKTTSGMLEDWHKSAFDYGYPFQSGWYRECVRNITGQKYDFAFVVTETQAPWRTAYFTPTPDFLAYGTDKALEAIDKLTECYATGIWEDRIEDMIVDLPKWSKPKEEA